MRFNNNNSIFSLYWSVGYYITVILNKLMYVFLIILSIILLRSSSVNGTFSTTINNIINDIYITCFKNIFTNSISPLSFDTGLRHKTQLFLLWQAALPDRRAAQALRQGVDLRAAPPEERLQLRLR